MNTLGDDIGFRGDIGFDDHFDLGVFEFLQEVEIGCGVLQEVEWDGDDELADFDLFFEPCGNGAQVLDVGACEGNVLD